MNEAERFHDLRTLVNEHQEGRLGASSQYMAWRHDEDRAIVIAPQELTTLGPNLSKYLKTRERASGATGVLSRIPVKGAPRLPSVVNSDHI